LGHLEWHERAPVGSNEKVTEAREQKQADGEELPKVRGMDMHSREQYLETLREEYRRSSKEQKTELLNEARKRTRSGDERQCRGASEGPPRCPGSATMVLFSIGIIAVGFSLCRL
jgi:hypothetical protein